MNRQKIKAIAVFVTTLVLILFATIAGNAFVEHRQIKQQWEDKKVELVVVQEEIKQLHRSLEQFEVEKKDFQQYLFSEQDVPSFLDGIASFARRADINVLDMKTKRFTQVRLPEEIEESQSDMAKKKRQKKQTEAEKQEELKRKFTLAAMPISIKVEGGYADFVKFLSHLENFKQLLTVSNVQIVSGREYPNLRSDFTLKIYSFKTLEELDVK